MQSASDSTVRRLSAYFRILEEARAAGNDVLSSAHLAARAGLTPAQVRKDLSCFGSFGKRGRGYDVAELREEIRRILGLDRAWRVALVGAGHLGSALFSYKGFEKQGFSIVAIFDQDDRLVGRSWGEIPIRPMKEFGRVAGETRVEIAIIATPAEAAQAVADAIVAGGVRGILNFSPRQLFVAEGVWIRNVDMAIELESLSFALARRR
jgi:redox-sensing transcriptional repressor